MNVNSEMKCGKLNSITMKSVWRNLVNENTNNQAEDYTRLKEGGTLTKCETVFFANSQDFGAGLPWFWDC